MVVRGGNSPVAAAKLLDSGVTLDPIADRAARRTMPHPKLTEQRHIWERKPTLRAVYRDYARRLRAACVPGVTVEVGSGSGWLGELWPGTVRTDLVSTPWIDVQASAQALPFRSGRIANVVGVDVLHHFPSPRRFFSEVQRVLQPRGRCVLIEPAMTPVSRAMFALFHPEPVDLSVDPLADQELSGRDPFDANQAIPSLLFRRGAKAFAREFPLLRVAEVRHFSFVAYPLSGAFREWSLLPAPWVGPTLRIEDRLQRVLGPLAAFRLMAVLEKVEGPAF
jgi:SAM-dependent methyltransferase